MPDATILYSFIFCYVLTSDSGPYHGLLVTEHISE